MERIGAGDTQPAGHTPDPRQAPCLVLGHPPATQSHRPSLVTSSVTQKPASNLCCQAGGTDETMHCSRMASDRRRPPRSEAPKGQQTPLQDHRRMTRNKTNSLSFGVFKPHKPCAGDSLPPPSLPASPLLPSPLPSLPPFLFLIPFLLHKHLGEPTQCHKFWGPRGPPRTRPQDISAPPAGPAHTLQGHDMHPSCCLVPKKKDPGAGSWWPKVLEPRHWLLWCWETFPAKGKC